AQPVGLSLSFHSAMDTHKCPNVIKIMASPLTLLPGGGRTLAARNRCTIAIIQCATTTKRASVRSFLRVGNLFLAKKRSYSVLNYFRKSNRSSGVARLGSLARIHTTPCTRRLRHSGLLCDWLLQS